MTADHEFDPADLLDQIVAASERLLDTTARLSDADVRAPSLLPGWSRGHVLTLSVPKTMSPYATCEYSLISPPSRSRRTILIKLSGAAVTGSLASGGRCWSVRCGLCRS